MINSYPSPSVLIGEQNSLHLLELFIFSGNTVSIGAAASWVRILHVLSTHSRCAPRREFFRGFLFLFLRPLLNVPQERD